MLHLRTNWVQETGTFFCLHFAELNVIVFFVLTSAYWCFVKRSIKACFCGAQRRSMGRTQKSLFLVQLCCSPTLPASFRPCMFTWGISTAQTSATFNGLLKRLDFLPNRAVIRPRPLMASKSSRNNLLLVALWLGFSPLWEII